MRTALCLSGHMRTFQKTIEEWRCFLLDKQKDFAMEIDVFIHTWETYGWRNQNQYAKDKYWLPDSSDRVDAEKIQMLFHPKTLVIEVHADKEPLFRAQAEPLYQLYEKYKARVEEKYAMDQFRPRTPMPSKAHVSQYYKKWACNELKRSYERTHAFVYDAVITSRPDVSINVLPAICFTDLNTVIWSSEFANGGNIDAVRVSDFFFISNSPNADYLTSVYPTLDQKIARYEQEDRIAELCQPDRMWYAHIVDGKLVSKKAPFHVSIASDEVKDDRPLVSTPSIREEPPQRRGWPVF